MLLAYAHYFFISTSVFAEARAIFLGHKYAKTLNVASIWIESDPLLLINCLNNVISTPWNIIYTVRGIKLLLHSFKEYKISHILSEGNMFADVMANLGIQTKTDQQFTDPAQLPTEAKGILRLDCLG